MKINHNYMELKANYLFADVARKVAQYQGENPGADVIRLGIGDVTLPLCGAVTQAMKDAVDEMGQAKTFRGYGPDQGYAFLQDAIKAHYASFGVSVEADEIFISDGAKSDVGNIVELFGSDNTVLVPDPVYPVYVDTNIMAGRKVVFVDGNEGNGFLPMPDNKIEADIIYLCTPNNPTGAVYDRAGLKAWVDYANARGAVILCDAAYETFITDSELPHSIFAIEGAKECAIEFCSFSKTAGFTGTRCGYAVVPKALKRDGASLHSMWLRRQTTKFNGVSYITQRGAQAAFSPRGIEETAQAVNYYRENARIISQALDELGIWYTGGKHSPYVWLKCGMPSWDFFDMLLRRANVVGTPGAGFGRNGEGFFRLTSFGSREKTIEAVARIKTLLG